MNKIVISYLPMAGVPVASEVTSSLDHMDAIAIANNPWPEYANSVTACCRVAHNGEALFLKYNVVEPYLLAKATTNQEVHEDSCVEFFIAFEDDENYYNLEFNCLGWSKMAYGADRKKRKALPAPLVEQVSSNAKIETSKALTQKTFNWEITLVIPRVIFCYHDFSSFSSLKARANFYKTGIKMPEPHFLTWKMIEAEEPDFHQKEYFGSLEFA